MRLTNLKKAVLSGVMALGLIAANGGEADAFSVDGSTVSVGDMFVVNFSLVGGQTDPNGNIVPVGTSLLATFKYTVDAFSFTGDGTADSATISIDVSNLAGTTAGNFITDFALVTVPGVTLSSFTAGSTFVNIVDNSSGPGFPGFTVSICGSPISSNCPGGAANKGLAPGASDTTIQLVLAGNFDMGGLATGLLTIDPSLVQYQGPLGRGGRVAPKGSQPKQTINRYLTQPAAILCVAGAMVTR